MNLANPETKVGLFVVVSFAAMVSIYMWLNGTQFWESGTQVEAVFDRVEGLRPGAPVKFNGVDVGRVTKLYFENLRVVVVMQISSKFEVPHATKAMIASAGVIGDKYIEITPLKPGDPVSTDDRITGQNSISLEQFYVTAYDVLNSFKKITADLELVSGQLSEVDLQKVLASLERSAYSIERLAETNEPQINEFIRNFNKASLELSQASSTANRFIKEIGDDQTAADLKQLMADARQVAANLETFTEILASKGPEFEQLLDDAHQTMQSIDQAAQKINQAVDQFTSGGGGGLSQIKDTLNDAGNAVKKVEKYVDSFEKIKFKQGLGAGYRSDERLTVDYRADLSFSDQNSLRAGLEDIGQDNAATLQWALKSPNLTGRIGVYRSEFGLGIDFPTSPNLSFGVDFWDTVSANLGLSSTWRFSKDWSLLLGGSNNFGSGETIWSLECWRDF